MARSYLNNDMGLYVKFDTDEHGRPSGCSGLNRKEWLDNMQYRSGTKFGWKDVMPQYSPETYLQYSSYNIKHSFVMNARFSDVVPGKRFSGCPLNDAKDEHGTEMYKIVEEFANDQQLWINEFTTVFQKMNENGNTDLTVASTIWQGLQCKINGEKC